MLSRDFKVKSATKYQNKIFQRVANINKEHVENYHTHARKYDRSSWSISLVNLKRWKNPGLMPFSNSKLYKSNRLKASNLSDFKWCDKNFPMKPVKSHVFEILKEIWDLFWFIGSLLPLFSLTYPSHNQQCLIQNHNCHVMLIFLHSFYF